MTAPVSSAAAQNGSRSGASSTLPIPRGKVEIIAPGKPAATADFSTAAGARAVLQRHARERHEARLRLGRGELRLVEEPAPGLAFGRRQLVAEPVRPAADHLPVDALLAHPGEAPRHVAQPLHDRPRRLAAGKGERQASAVLDQAQRGKAARSLRIAARSSGGTRWPWTSMIIRIPFLLLSLFCRPRDSGDPVTTAGETGARSRPKERSVVTGSSAYADDDTEFFFAAAIMSPSCAILIGRLLTTIPSGRTASLTALAIAAGAPR